MTEAFGYADMFSWWHNVNNIARALAYIKQAEQPKPQNAQRKLTGRNDYAHGNALVGHIKRRVYFDLGGEYDLIDDTQFEEIQQAIQQGRMPGASMVTPEQLGFSSKGVPIDVACTTSAEGSSVTWIKRWMKATVRLTTDSGRTFTLHQLCIGFVRRTTPLLILGKNTCGICGYRTIRRQDSNRHDKRGENQQQHDLYKHRQQTHRQCNHQNGRSNTTENQTHRNGKDSQNKHAKNDYLRRASNVTTTSILESNKPNSTRNGKALEVEVMHENEQTMPRKQFMTIATSDIPFTQEASATKDENEQDDDGTNKHRKNKRQHHGYYYNKQQQEWKWADDRKHHHTHGRHGHKTHANTKPE